MLIPQELQLSPDPLLKEHLLVKPAIKKPLKKLSGFHPIFDFVGAEGFEPPTLCL